MDYHADRFSDASFLLLRGQKVIALLPAHITGQDLVSHQGLSFGGWIQTPDCRHFDLNMGFELLQLEMRQLQLSRLVYTPSPYPYHVSTCDDDLYLLNKLGGKCVRVKLAAFLKLDDFPHRKSEFRRRLRRAEKLCPGEIVETKEVEPFWDRLSDFLAARHAATPAHNAAEMALLKSRFPNNIRLFVLQNRGEILAGEVVYLSRNVLRYQYGFYFSEEPKAILGVRLQEWIRSHKELVRPWMDLGTSMDPETGELQQTLHMHKENFGAHGVLMQTWVWEP